MVCVGGRSRRNFCCSGTRADLDRDYASNRYSAMSRRVMTVLIGVQYSRASTDFSEPTAASIWRAENAIREIESLRKVRKIAIHTSAGLPPSIIFRVRFNP